MFTSGSAPLLQSASLVPDIVKVTCIVRGSISIVEDYIVMYVVHVIAPVHPPPTIPVPDLLTQTNTTQTHEHT